MGCFHDFLSVLTQLHSIVTLGAVIVGFSLLAIDEWSLRRAARNPR